MKVVALVSGGKDSCYNMMQCVANGHEIVALANLKPSKASGKDELDSFMYQTVGHDAIHFYAECMDLPLYRREILGSSVLLTPDYVVTRDDETEDLLCLLQDVMEKHPDVEAVSVGAILSNYQRIRVEHVCNRLGLISMAYLWRRDQKELLSEMASAGVGAVLIKVAAMGLSARHLGKSIAEMYPFLCTMNEQYDLHICGEGGEYETFTLDCPLFKKRIVIDEIEVVTHDDAAFAPVAYLKFKQCHLEQKSEEEMQSVSDVVTIPRWEESWDRYQDIVESIQPTGSVDKLTFNLPLVDSVKCRKSQYNLSNQGDYYAIAGTTAYTNNDSDSTITAIPDIQEETRQCMQNIQKQLENVSLTWDDVVMMQVYVANMADFGLINQVYKTFFDINPPPRALVGTTLEQPVRLQIDIIARRSSPQNSKQTMHVQGMSYWAPANIGPYSQSAVTRELAFIAGQIGMIPNTLDLPQPRSLVSEAALSLRNLENITKVLNLDLEQEVALCYCYVSDPNLLPNAQRAWTAYFQNTSSPLTMFVAVTTLPKNALIEWQVVLGVKNSMPDSDDSDDSDEDDKPTKAIDAILPGRTITERSDILVETQIWSSETMYFAASYTTINDDTLSLNSVIDTILADIGKSISVFGTGWQSVLAIRVFYCLQQDESSCGKLEGAFKQRFSDMSPSSQPAITMVPATAIGPDAQASLGVCIQAVNFTKSVNNTARHFFHIMFTGIVEYMGTVVAVSENDTTESGGNGWTVTVGDATCILDDCHIGDSISINGTCLTVTEFTKDTFKVGMAPETLRKTNLGDLKVGSKVNLERAMSANKRFGGHMVQGHVDDTATILSITPEGNSLWYKLQLPNNTLLPYIIPKGFIALDGTSLTVCDVNDAERWFTIMMIAHTQDCVVMAKKQPGDRVNIEVDMVGKYALKSLEGAMGSEGVEALVKRLLTKAQ